MDWLTERPPSTVDVCGETVPIRTGWRRAVRSLVFQGDRTGIPIEDCDKLLSSWFSRDGETPEVVRLHTWQALDAAFAWRDGALVEAMPYGDGTDRTSPGRVWDWEADSGIVVVDFRRLYGIDLTDPRTQMHWWRFALLWRGAAATESLASAAISARSPLRGDHDKWQRMTHERQARAWALPPTQAEAMQRLREAW